MSSTSSSASGSASSGSTISGSDFQMATTATPMTSTAASASSSASDPGGSNPMPSGTNYFFGFLVAFIAFLFIFLSLGFLARRRRLRLLQEFMLYGPQDDDYPRIPQTEPILYEPKFVDAAHPLWADIMPLSTSLVQREVLQSKDPAPSPSPPNPPPASGISGLRAYLDLPHRKAQSDAPPTPQLAKVTEALDIAVLINMPQPSETSSHHPDYDEGPPECLIGTLHLPWTDNVEPSS